MFITSVQHDFKINSATGQMKLLYELDLPSEILKDSTIEDSQLVELIDRYLRISGSFLSNILVFYNQEKNYRIPLYTLGSSIKELESKNNFFRDFSKKEKLLEPNLCVDLFTQSVEDLYTLLGQQYSDNEDISNFLIRLATKELDTKVTYYKNVTSLFNQ